ncbi:hypothetical protein BDY24DRAFT_374167 [Mrakia frigida]|uniref:uncharacterized protein n=1 Tax=Mrakia frigida TaxID=29902 RepID=UPI003FCBF344
MDSGKDVDAELDLDDDDRDVDLLSEWDSERTGREIRLAKEHEARALARSKHVSAAVPVNENSLGIKRRTLGVGRPKRKALISFNGMEKAAETDAARAGEVASSSIGSHAIGLSSNPGASSHPMTRSQSHRTIFRLGTSTSFKKIKRVLSEVVRPALPAPTKAEAHATNDALGNDEIQGATSHSDESTSKGEGSSTQINNESADAKVKIKTEEDKTAVGRELEKVKDDAKTSTTDPASTIEEKDSKATTQLA